MSVLVEVLLCFLTSTDALISFCLSPYVFLLSLLNQIPIISADHLTSHKYVTQM